MTKKETKINNLITAIVGKVTSLISAHNSNNNSHSDIRNQLNNKIEKSSTAGLIKNDGSIDTTTYVTTTDSRLSNARTPTSHTHGNLQNNGQIGSTIQASKNVVTDSNGKITTENKPTIPSKTSDLTNDSNFISIQVVNSKDNLSDGIYIYEE